jgi:hypothetical protein
MAEPVYEGAPVDVVEVAGRAATYETDWNHLLGPRPILIVPESVRRFAPSSNRRLSDG